MTGHLTFIEAQRQGVGGVDGLGGPRGVAVSPDGTFVYAAASFSDSLAVFRRDSVTGALTFLEGHFDGVRAGAIPLVRWPTTAPARSARCTGRALARSTAACSVRRAARSSSAGTRRPSPARRRLARGRGRPAVRRCVPTGSRHARGG